MKIDWGWETVQMDHVDYKYDWIEKQIKAIANAMVYQSEEEIVKSLEEKNVNSGDIFLIMQGAKLLYNDRISAPPKRTFVRRI